MHAVITAGLVSTITLFSPPVKPLTPERIQELMKKLEEIDPDPRLKSLNGLQLHSPAIMELATAGPEVVPTLIDIYENKKNSPALRAHAATAVARHLNGFFTVVDQRVVRLLKAGMKDVDPVVRRGILVGWVNWYRYEPDWLNERERNPAWPSLHSRTFPRHTARLFLPDFIEGLRDPNASSASIMASKISLLGEPGIGIKELIEATQRPEPEIRGAAIVALGRVGADSPEALEVVMKFLASKKYGPQTYREFSRDDESKQYLTAVCAIGLFGAKAKGAVPTLIETIESSGFKWQEFSSVYECAVLALGLIGPAAKEAVPAIQKFIFVVGPSTPQQLAMIDALEKIDLKAGAEARAKYQKIIDDFRRPRDLELPPTIPPIPIPKP